MIVWSERTPMMPTQGPTDLGVLVIGLMAYTAHSVINRRPRDLRAE